MNSNTLRDLSRRLKVALSVFLRTSDTSKWAFAFFAGTSIRARLLRGISWSLVGSVAAGLLQLLLGVVLARELGREGYGQFSVVLSTASTAFMTIGMVLGLLATRQVAASRAVATVEAGRASAFAVVVGWCSGVFLALCLWLGSGYLSRAIVGNEDLRDFLVISSLIVVPSVVALAQQGVLAGLERFREIAMLKACSWLLIVLASYILAVHFSVTGALVGFFVASVATALIGWSLVRRGCRAEGIPFRLSKGAFGAGKPVWRDSIPALLSNVIGLPMLWYANVLLASAPGGLNEIAVVNAAMSWRNALLLLPTVICQSLLPVLSSLWDQKSGQNAARTLIWRAIGGVGVVSLFLAAAIAVASPKIMSAYGVAFAAEYPTLVLLMVSAVAASIASVLGIVLFVAGKLWESLWLNLATNLVLILFVAALRGYGAEGFALGYAMAFCLHAVVASLYVHRLMRSGELLGSRA
jgi:O-antigen/teichoic acid export membrane protein